MAKKATKTQDKTQDAVQGSEVELPLGALDALVGYHLRRSSAVFATDFNRVLDATGMRQVSFAVLSMIAEHPESNQGAIGRALGIQRANMVALIGDLMAQELIERVVAADDRRAFSLRLTRTGKAMMRRCHTLIDAHEAALLADFDEAERLQLIALLTRIEAKER